jgi:hypothetical protein
VFLSYYIVLKLPVLLLQYSVFFVFMSKRTTIYYAHVFRKEITTGNQIVGWLSN